MSSLSQRRRHRKAHGLPLPRMARDQKGDPEAFRKWEQKAKNPRKSGSGKEVSSRTLKVKANGTGVHFSMTQWKSEKHQSWSIPAEGFKGHVTTDDSPQGIAGKWGAGVGRWCNWIMMKRWDPLHGMYGSVEAEFEVQRTIKRAELTAFLCRLKKVIGPMVHVDNKGIIRWAVERRKEMHRSKSW